MKKCPYCGKEYSDSAAVCELDANPLTSGKAAGTPLDRNAPMTAIDKYFANSSGIYFWGFNARLLWSFIGVLACKHPAARKNACVYFAWQAGALVLAIIIIALVKNAQAK